MFWDFFRNLLRPKSRAYCGKSDLNWDLFANESNFKGPFAWPRGFAAAKCAAPDRELCHFVSGPINIAANFFRSDPQAIRRSQSRSGGDSPFP